METPHSLYMKQCMSCFHSLLALETSTACKNGLNDKETAAIKTAADLIKNPTIYIYQTVYERDYDCHISSQIFYMISKDERGVSVDMEWMN